jgi:hypothetical protein
VAKAEPTEGKLREARSTAKLVIHPAANAALVIKEFSDHFGDFNVGVLAAHLKDGMNDLSNNDLRSCEAMLDRGGPNHRDSRISGTSALL